MSTQSGIHDLPNSPTVTMASPSTTRCMLLELPREMRDIIYKNVLDTSTDENIDLCHDAAPPSKALCCVNKQIHAETHKMHQQAHRTFWRNNNFVIPLSTAAECMTAWSFNCAEEANINNISNLQIKFRSVHTPTMQILHLCPGGSSWGWEWEKEDNQVHLVIGFEPIAGGMHIGISQVMPTGPREDVYSAAEATIRLQDGIHPAPPLIDQLKVLSEFAARQLPWYDEENWSRVYSEGTKHHSGLVSLSG